MKRSIRYPPAPALFPLAVVPRCALDLIPETADPTGRGERAWQIFSRLPIVEGPHAGVRIGEHSPPWQRKFVRLIFGHTDERGLRVLREVFALIAKKNAKSATCAALALTKLLLDEERREQVICLAATRTQARIVFDSMASMIRADATLGERFEVVDYRNIIKYGPTDSRVTAVAAELAATVGQGASLGIIDELHLLGASPRGGALVRQLRSGSIARAEPLMVSISTAPLERSEGVYQATYERAKRIVAGLEVDPAFFAWLCEAPQGLNPEDPATWVWTNPSIGYTTTIERLEAELETARSDPAALRDYRSQHLSVPPELSAGTDRWIPVAQWNGVADDTLTLEGVLTESYRLYCGVDRGQMDDLTALVVLGKKIDGQVLVWSHQWVSRAGYERRHTVNDYDQFISRGELTLYEGGNEDLEQLVALVRQVQATGKLSLTGIDSFTAADTGDALRDLVDVQSVPQGWQLTGVIAWVERLIASRTLKHHGSSLLAWNVGNAHCERRGNATSVTKATVVGSAKIDGLAALFTAAAVCIARSELDQPSVYDERARRGERAFLIVGADDESQRPRGRFQWED